MKEKFVMVGEIVNTHGVRGELKILPHCDSASFLLRFKRFFVDGIEHKIISSRVHRDVLLVNLENISDIDSAKKLVGSFIHIDRDEAGLCQGGYFIQDIIGAEVFDESGRMIGKLTEVIDGPAGLIYVVQGDEEHLIPAVPEFILSTDADMGIIRVHLIDGM